MASHTLFGRGSFPGPPEGVSGQGHPRSAGSRPVNLRDVHPGTALDTLSVELPYEGVMFETGLMLHVANPDLISEPELLTLFMISRDVRPEAEHGPGVHLREAGPAPVVRLTTLFPVPL